MEKMAIWTISYIFLSLHKWEALSLSHTYTLSHSLSRSDREPIYKLFILFIKFNIFSNAYKWEHIENEYILWTLFNKNMIQFILYISVEIDLAFI